MKSVSLALSDGRMVEIAVRHSLRARRIAIRVRRGVTGIELVVPQAASMGGALEFLHAHADWIAARLGAVPMPLTLEPGLVVPLLGEPHRIVHLASPSGRRRPFSIVEGRIEIAGRPEHVRRRLRDGLRRHAHDLLTRKTVAAAVRIGRGPVSVAVGDALTRWGSCAARGRIRYSWRLVFAPERVMDYVVMHEVAHLIEMNHSARFWSLVESLHAGHRADRAWLSANGPLLLSYN